MKKLYPFYNYLLIFTLALIHSSCSRQKEVKDILSQAENVVEQYPDSALVLLDFIQNPYELSKKQHAEYTLYFVQAKDKAFKNIASDTLIFKARDYFKKKNDIKNWSLSEFYCGRVLQTQEKIDEAMKSYLKAKKMAEEIDDIYLCGLVKFFIGELNYDQDLYDEAISEYQSAMIDFSHLKDAYKKQIAIYTCIGNSFLLKGSSDSAFHYYQKGLDLAKLNNDSIQQINIQQNMGAAYLEIGRIDFAKKVTMQMLPLSTNENQQAKLYLNLAKIYIGENKKDSAIYYSNLSIVLSGNDFSLKTSIYQSLSIIEESMGNYQKSLDYHQQYTKYLAFYFEEKENNHIWEVQKKYDFELLQSANRKLVIERMWISILSIFIIFSISFLFYRNRFINREALLTAKQQIYQMKALADEKKEATNSYLDKKNIENNTDLRILLLKQLDIFMKIALLEPLLKIEEKEKGKKILEKVNKIMYNSTDSFNWEIFYQPVNALHNNLLKRLSNLYPELDKEDIRICCLSKIGFNNTEIALLVKSNQNIIQKKKTSIRKKIGMNKKENFIKQLDEIVKKKE